MISPGHRRANRGEIRSSQRDSGFRGHAARSVRLLVTVTRAHVPGVGLTDAEQGQQPHRPLRGKRNGVATETASSAGEANRWPAPLANPP